MWQKTDNVREQTVLRKCWFLSDWLSASTDGSRLKSIFCMQTTVFCPFFLHFSHISVNSDVLSLAVGHQKPVPQAKSHWGVFCCPGTDGSPLQHTREAGCSTQKKPVHPCWAGQGDSHQDTQIHSMYTGHFLTHHTFQRLNSPGFSFYTHLPEQVDPSLRLS